MTNSCVICGNEASLEASPNIYFCSSCALRSLDAAAERAKATVTRSPKGTVVKARVTLIERDRIEAAAASHFDGNYSHLIRTAVTRLLDDIDAGVYA